MFTLTMAQRSSFDLPPSDFTCAVSAASSTLLPRDSASSLTVCMMISSRECLSLETTLFHDTMKSGGR